ncbi:MAG: hypothetical protein ACK5T0_00030 [Vampirovibrionales bacterium]
MSANATIPLKHSKKTPDTHIGWGSMSTKRQVVLVDIDNAKHSRNFSLSYQRTSQETETLTKKLSMLLSSEYEQFRLDLEEVKKSCSMENWDGYGALPLNKTSVFLAERFIKSRPSDLPYPKLCPEPDGDLGMDWTINQHQLALSIDEKGLLSYAYIHPHNGRSRGSMKYDGLRIPNVIKAYFDLMGR